MDIALYLAAATSLIMAAAAALSAVSRFVGLPMPVVVAFAGLLYGVVGLASGVSFSGAALDSYDRWFVESLALDASGLLLLFLPPLLFEMAMGVDLRRIRDEAATIAIMAIIAVLVATATVGASVWLGSAWMGSGLGLVACLLLGAAVSTTDPAAVITTFREIGAPRRLAALLEGESLLNDAAAIALYALLLGVAASQGSATVGGFLGDFSRSFLVGAGTGLAMAWLAARVYPLLGASAAAEASATVALAYGAHLAAEVVFGGSGVVAVVVAGAVTGSSGFVSMGPRNWATTRAVWAQIGFWANAAILFIVASATPALLADFTVADGALVVLVYVAALLARGAVLFGLLPALDRAGLSTPIGARQKALLLWGGVRGAVTLVLAISLTEVSALGDDAGIVGAVAAAYTLATLGLNAATLGWVTRRLGLDRLSPADAALRERVAAGAIERVADVVSNLARARDIEPEAIAFVTDALRRRRMEAEEEAEAEAEGERIPFGERLRLGLAIVCGQEARLVRRAFEAGALGPRAPLARSGAAARLADAARVGSREGYDAAVAAELRPTAWFRAVYRLHRLSGVSRPLRQALELRQTCLLETERVIGELQAFSQARLPAMVGADAAANIAAALAGRLTSVVDEITALSLQYPAYALALEKALMARAAVRRERQEYDRLHRDGVVGPELREALARELDDLERRVAAPPRLDVSPSSIDLLSAAPMFAGLDDRQKRRVAKLLRTRPIFPGDVVAEIGERGDTLHFVASGALEVEHGDGRSITLSNGAFFGELGLLAPSRRRATRVVSLTFGQLLTLSRRDFRRLASREPEIEQRIRAAAEAQLRGGFSIPARREP